MTKAFHHACRSLVLAAAALFVLSASCNESGAAAAKPEPAPVTPPVAAPPVTTPQGRLVEVVATLEGYAPKSIPAKVGETLTLRFVRKTESKCLEEVMFKDLGIKKVLPMNEPVDIVVKAEKAGTIEFSCGMAMVFGKIVVEG